MPAAGAGAGAGATAVPAEEAGTTPVAAAAVGPLGGAVTAFWTGGAAGPAEGAAPFPFKTLNHVEQVSVGVGQTPAHCGDLCLSGVPSVAAQFLQIFY